MALVEEVLQRLGGQEIESTFDELNPLLPIGMAIIGPNTVRELFRIASKLSDEQQLAIAMYGMDKRRYFVFPAGLDKYSFIPALKQALYRDTGKVWGMDPEI